MKILVIIPAYNEAESIVTAVDALRVQNPDVDYIVINDGSTDETASICLQNGYNKIDLPLNMGIGGAVQTGYLYAVNNDYDITIQMDGDGQHNPEYIDALIAPIAEGRADIVIGSRFIRSEGFQSYPLRRYGIKLLNTIIYIVCGYKPTDATSGFRAANKEAVKFFSDTYACDYPEPEAIVSSVLQGFRVIEAPVSMLPRTGGFSSISKFKSLLYMVKVSLSLLFYRISVKKVKK